MKATRDRRVGACGQSAKSGVDIPSAYSLAYDDDGLWSVIGQTKRPTDGH